MTEQQIKAAAEEILNLWWIHGGSNGSSGKQEVLESIIRKHVCSSVEQQNNFMGEVLKDI